MTLKIDSNELQQMLASVDDNQFQYLEKYVMFLGHAHSGHSIIGAIIDSHAEAAIANEINVPKLMVDFKLSNTDICKLTLHSALSQYEKNWTNTGYRYNIPDSYQGSVNQLRVLGDKKGGGSTRIIRKHPWVFENMINMFKEQFRVIHVKRNIYDNIAAFAHYWQEPLGEQHVVRYFENLETIHKCKHVIPPTQWLTLDHDEFINDLDQSLNQLFTFLQLELTEKHRMNIKSIVNKNTHSRRNTVQWPDHIHDLIHNFQNKIN
ncbi:MAG: sulfotransferase [Marinicella sp.]